MKTLKNSIAIISILVLTIIGAIVLSGPLNLLAGEEGVGMLLVIIGGICFVTLIFLAIIYLVLDLRGGVKSLIPIILIGYVLFVVLLTELYLGTIGDVIIICVTLYSIKLIISESELQFIKSKRKVPIDNNVY